MYRAPFIVLITTIQCTIIYYSRIFLYNIHSYMFRHFYVIIEEFYICALISYTNS